MHSLIIHEAREYILEVLQCVDHYPYHNIDHTLGVYLRAQYLCLCEQIGPEDMEDVLLAALFHDTGFIQTYKNNEPVGASIAREWLEKHHWDIKRIETIERLILATKFPENLEQLFHIPSDILEMIIQDADMDNLGRRDNGLQSQAIFTEVRTHGGAEHLSWEAFQISSLHVLEQYQFHTQTAQDDRNLQKQRNHDLLLSTINT